MVVITMNIVSPTGYVELDNDCNYSIDLKSTRSREEVNPKEDLAFYFNTYIVPKYGLNNINVNNVASFMKDLEMNWTKLDSGLKGKVLDILVDGILNDGSSFKNDLIAKMGVNPVPPVSQVPVEQQSSFTNIPNAENNGKSNFGASSDNNLFMNIGIAVIVLAVAFFIFDKFQKNKVGGYPKFK
jgi:hypothetical protein